MLGAVGRGVADRARDEARGPGGAVGTVPDEAGPAAPAGPAGGDEARLGDDVGVVAEVGASGAEDEVVERRGVDGAEVGAPGDDARRPGDPGGEDEGGALTAQVEGRGGGCVGARAARDGRGHVAVLRRRLGARASVRVPGARLPTARPVEAADVLVCPPPGLPPQSCGRRRRSDGRESGRRGGGAVRRARAADQLTALGPAASAEAASSSGLTSPSTLTLSR